MRHQNDIFFFSHSRCRHKLQADRHPRHHRSHSRRSAAIIRRNHPPSPNCCDDRSDRYQYHQNNDVTHSLADWTTSNVLSFSNSNSIPASNDVDSVHTCPYCDCTFTSNIGLVGHLRIYRAKTDEPVPGALAYIRRIHSHWPHCPYIQPPHGPIKPHAHLRKAAVDNRLLHYTITSPPPPPTTTTTTCTSQHHYTRKHPIATSYVDGKCASRFFLHAAPLPHVRSESETIAVGRAPWLGRLSTDALTQSTQSAQMREFV
nr:unnamed protein product [Spirometra erinaceieuropaei]